MNLHRSSKVTGNVTVAYSAYNFVLPFYGNYGPSLCCFYSQILLENRPIFISQLYSTPPPV